MPALPELAGRCGLFGIPRDLGLATATTSAVFFPHLEQRIRTVRDKPFEALAEAVAQGGLFLPKPDHDEHKPCTERRAAGPSWDSALLLHFRLDVTEL
jgi:hypothetical protein